jgi:hypothetical protein
MRGAMDEGRAAQERQSSRSRLRLDIGGPFHSARTDGDDRRRQKTPAF